MKTLPLQLNLYTGERGLVVGGTAVNGVNCGDILGDGTASYDYDTNTLSLNNAVIEIAKYNDLPTAYGIRYNVEKDIPFKISCESTYKKIRYHSYIYGSKLRNNRRHADDQLFSSGYCKPVDGNSGSKWIAEDTYIHILLDAQNIVKMNGYSLITDNENNNANNWIYYTIYGANFASADQVTRNSSEWKMIKAVVDDDVLEGILQ